MQRFLFRSAAALAVAAGLAGIARSQPSALVATSPAVGTPARVGPARLTDESLGHMLKATGLTGTQAGRRHDFKFGTKLDGDEWTLSMSAVLSENGEDLWLMAWLDELPKSANDVPRTALLRMLAVNDTLGSGKFFAYVPANRRFVLERVVPNENLTTATLSAVLKDLGATVRAEHAVWSTDNWKATEPPAAAATTAPSQPPIRNAVNDPNYNRRTIR